MAHGATPLGQFKATSSGLIVPAATGDPPDVRADLLLAITAIERRVNMAFTSRTTRDSTLSSLVAEDDGMTTYMQDVDEIDTRINGAWVKTWPTQYSGTGVPSNTLGGVGDYYAQYV